MNDLAFTVVDHDEPHRRRRREIARAHPEVRALFGYDSRTVVVTFAVVVAQLGIAALLRNAAAWVVLACAASFGAVLSHWCAMAIHETTHDLAARRQSHNKLLALVANVPMVLPVAMSFRRYHLAHHGLLGVRGEDTDLPLAAEVRWVGTRPARKLAWLSLYFAAYLGRALGFVARPNRDEILNWAIQAPVSVACFFLFGPAGLAYLLLSTVIGHSLHPVAAHFVHEHYVLAEGQETYSYYGPLNHVTFNVGYHVEHHDFMNVPGWRLPALHRLAREYYAPLTSHRSWTWVLWNFVVDETMGPHQRIVRTRETHDRARLAVAS